MILHDHHGVHVLLSITIAVLGSWTALDLNGRVLARTGRTRWAWLAATALAMGLSIWSMHFVAMLRPRNRCDLRGLLP
jgi:NO-binding membrane sensor protein with MHYT domain